EVDLKQFRSENEKLQAELKEAKARISQLENEMFHLKSLESENSFLKSQGDMQAKSLVIMGEREEQLKDAILLFRTKVKKSPEDETQLQIYRKELQAMQEVVNDQNSELTFVKCQISELEGSIIQKEHQTRDLKKT
ncbi:hypothetical protein, partial [Salmonella sp. s51933]|uniref:hypothetical protein n=1 Tax=Salmonella sp. s51933 TaxID=3160127 RepID=UPI003754F908